MPLRRPSWNQMVSAISEATIAMTSEPKKLKRPVPASAPAANKIGKDGIGSPICSANTHPSRTT